jgi:hypothetical protein
MTMLVPDTLPSLVYSNTVTGPLTFTLTAPYPFGTVYVLGMEGAAIGQYSGTGVFQVSIGPAAGSWPAGGTLTFSGSDGYTTTFHDFAKVNIQLTVGFQYTVTPSAGFPAYAIRISVPPEETRQHTTPGLGFTTADNAGRPTPGLPK